MEAVKAFFSTGYLFKPINITSITLLPKVANASDVKQFRPISYYLVLYKLISRVMAVRMLLVMPRIIHLAQAGFIPGSQLVDNILLASELMKGYGWKSISPRCMIKIDFIKAYDSVEWPFLRCMLNELTFPEVFVSWVMNCRNLVSYSILFNGRPTKPFQARGSNVTVIICHLYGLSVKVPRDT